MRALKGTKVVVTTDKDRQGVFYGTLDKHEGDEVELLDARMAVYWSEQTKGVVGLASIGPQVGSRITPPAPRIWLNGVTAIMVCSKEAVKQWEKGLWIE